MVGACITFRNTPVGIAILKNNISNNEKYVIAQMCVNFYNARAMHVTQRQFSLFLVNPLNAQQLL